MGILENGADKASHGREELVAKESIPIEQWEMYNKEAEASFWTGTSILFFWFSELDHKVLIFHAEFVSNATAFLILFKSKIFSLNLCCCVCCYAVSLLAMEIIFDFGILHHILNSFLL